MSLREWLPRAFRVKTWGPVAASPFLEAWSWARARQILTLVLVVFLVQGFVLGVIVGMPRLSPQVEDAWSGQWHSEMVGAGLAYEAGFRGQGIKIAVLDTGIDFEHRDLDEGVIRDGSNFAHGPKGYYHDALGHGSHVAGIVASQEKNFMGIAPEAEIYSVKTLSDYGWGYWTWVRKGIEWAIENEMDIVSMSWGGTLLPQSFHDVIMKAEAAGILLISSAGNQGNASYESYPAALPEVMAVGAVGKSLDIPSWSARQDYVEIAAPGWIVLSTCTGLFRDAYAWAGFGYLSHCWVSGTSMAAPAVAAAAAVLMSSPIPTIADLNENRQWDANEVRQWLTRTAYDIGERGWDRASGWGVVDLGTALGLGTKAPSMFESASVKTLSQSLFIDWSDTIYDLQLIMRMEA